MKREFGRNLNKEWILTYKYREQKDISYSDKQKKENVIIVIIRIRPMT